jgi:hypothetical protein
MAGMDYRRLLRLRRKQQRDQQQQKRAHMPANKNFKQPGQTPKSVGWKGTIVGKTVGGATVSKRVDGAGTKALASPLSISNKTGAAESQSSFGSSISGKNPIFPMKPSNQSHPALLSTFWNLLPLAP